MNNDMILKVKNNGKAVSQCFTALQRNQEISLKKDNSVKIETTEHGDNCVITVYNMFKSENCFEKIVKILKLFTLGQELFFGFYRTDGLTLTKEEWVKCDKEIPHFFNENGEYKEISERIVNRWRKVKEYKGYLTVARAYIDDSLFEEIKWILQYYLETTFFVPSNKFNFVEFENEFRNYMKNPIYSFLDKGYTEMLFQYYDSRHFSVVFNAQRYNCEDIKNKILLIV